MDDLPNDAHSKEVVRLWRAWKTVHEMVADREYELAEDEINISLDRFRSEFCNPDGTVNRGKLQFSARPSDAMLRKHTPPATDANPDPVADCGPIWVEFLADKQFGVAQIRQFAKYTITNHYKTGIMVTHVALSPAARKSLASVENLAKIECFLEDDLLVNITHHELVPRHVLLSREEKIALLKRYRLKETQLPRILAKDPVARYLGLKRGQVVKIIRALRLGYETENNDVYDSGNGGEENRDEEIKQHKTEGEERTGSRDDSMYSLIRQDFAVLQVGVLMGDTFSLFFST
ncbi:DNA-directed RNA polymerases II 24 kDa polypeptide [Cordyceps militaris]|uniref:DNA-directed RNA polymerases I, II, and III subunit RPABC1 n=1 Tax=Cordyceps militaris TaxID=73501 RepID=A0A2H4SBF0_CORMI|nr:DNA-directed RNA polymerases II 24 kDa polypeptide [Cordyceps militaris]